MKGILAIDCGNTMVKAAYFDDDRLVASTRVDYANPAVISRFVSSHKPLYAIVSSVHHAGGEQEMLREVSARCPHVLEFGHDTPIPLRVMYKQHQIGVDRVAAAVGAHSRFAGERLLVVDAGTAMTLDVVDHDGTLMGGFITTGVSMSLHSLHEHTSLLPEVSTAGPQLVDGLPHDTEQAMRWGAILGAAAQVEQCAVAHDCDLVVLTGGDAELLSPHITKRHCVVSDVVLHGLEEILRFNIDNEYV